MIPTAAPQISEGLINFLIAAKRVTYAGDGGGTDAVLPGSRQLEYRQGPYVYRDIYFGSDFFAGQEVVSYEERPVWTMIYAGGMIATADTVAVYTILKTALLRVKPERPYRGPAEYRQADWLYRDRSGGTPERFDGEEEIWQDQMCVYRLKYAGGALV